MSSRDRDLADNLVQFNILQSDGAGGFTPTTRLNPADGQLERWDAATGAYVAAGGNPLMPIGLNWLTDTINSYDIYSLGFVQRPTIFFDPQASDSNGRGTFAKPYTTALQLEAAVNRLSKGSTVHMGGQVIGLKRGSKLHGGLHLNIAGASGDPVFVVPYGDAEALPIITGATVYGLTGNVATGWAATADSRIYKITQASEFDAFDVSMLPVYNQRFVKVTPGANEAAAIAALVAAGPGHSAYVSSLLLIYPFNGVPDWHNIEVNNVTHTAFSGTTKNTALDIRYTNLSATGFITIAGIHTRSTASMGTFVAPPATYATIASITGIQRVGCISGNNGIDISSTADSMAAIAYTGVSNAIRLASCLEAGNYSYDAVNNGCEVTHSTGFVREFSKSEYTTGPGILELYGNNSSTICRYNFARGRRNKLLLNQASLSFGHKGIWQSAYSTGTTRANLQTQDNTFHHNVMVEIGPGQGIDICGLNTLLYNNYVDSDVTGGGNVFTINDDAANHSTTTAKNNVFFSTAGAGGGRNVYAVAGTVTTLSNNYYRRSDGSVNVYVGGVGYTSMANIRATPDAGAQGDVALTVTEGRPQSAGDTEIFGMGVAVAGITEIDKDGVYAATPAIGAYYVGS